MTGALNEINACTNLDADGEYYLLDKDVESMGTCFNIGANNITLDGAGHKINFSALYFGYGIFNNGFDNITIKNLNINQINFTLPYPGFNDSYEAYMKRDSSGELIDSKGISLYRSENCFISNVTTNVSRESIQLSKSNNNTLENSRAISNRSAAIFLHLSDNNTFANVTGISTTYNTNKSFQYGRRSAGMQLCACNYNRIMNSNGTANIGMGIYIEGSNNNLENSIGISKSNIGLDIYKKSKNNILLNCTGISVSNYGIRIYNAEKNIISFASGISETNYGIFLFNSSYNIINNSIGISNTNYGIRLYNSTLNDLRNSKAESNTMKGISFISSENNNI